MTEEEKAEVRINPIGVECTGVYIPSEHAAPPSAYCVTPYYQEYIDSILIPHGMIKERTKKLAKDIFQYYEKLEGELICIATMNGASSFFAALSNYLTEYANHVGKLNRPTYFVEFMKCSSYVGMSNNGPLEVTQDLERIYKNASKKHVLVVEDLIDSGKSLTKICDVLQECSPLSIKTVCMLSKRSASWNNFVPDWVGFDIDDNFIVGFGCDIDEYFRDLNHICIINDNAKNRFVK